MKLFRFGPSSSEKPGFVWNGRRLDASAFGEDYGENFFSSDGLRRLNSWCDGHAAGCPMVPDDARTGPALTRPSKIVCVGLNYRDHAVETGAAIPKEPVLFLKATSAITGPNDNVVLPRGSRKSDWEVELGVVIQKKAKYVPVDRALEYVAGYVLLNDYSEREFQKERGGQFTKGKSADSFAPIGPWLVTPDEFSPDNAGLWLKVNGRIFQNANTAGMLFNVPTLVSYISEFMTLLPGDVISTGTPSGVGLGQKPPVFLQPGDIVEYGIDGLGEARQQVVAFDSDG